MQEKKTKEYDVSVEMIFDANFKTLCLCLELKM